MKNKKPKHFLKYLRVLRKNNLVQEFEKAAKTTEAFMDQVAGNHRKTGVLVKKGHKYSTTDRYVTASENLAKKHIDIKGLPILTHHQLRPDFYKKAVSAA